MIIKLLTYIGIVILSAISVFVTVMFALLIVSIIASIFKRRK